ncbi:GOLPH3/VPS74 family protein [Halalkalibacillus halophilus]|uniref:GOLPH3/VPS74 family protein n=1 Tax=Halalkalibacillus halophilus TaxID=392827 RepID=UPI0003FDB0BE|nr:GPP34 family phosphoprotein [Halalkalibacillus halophilus]
MYIQERILLLGTKRDKGSLPMDVGSKINLNIAGAILMELALLDRIDIRKKKLTVKNSEPTGTGIFDDALQKMMKAKKERKAKYWVEKLASNRLLDETYATLTEKGILRNESYRFIGLFPVRRYPIEKSSEVELLREEVREAVFTDDIESVEDPRTVLLVGLLKTSNLLPKLFSREERKEAKKRVKEIMNSQVVSKSVSEAVQAVDSAVIAAVGAASVASSSSS